MDSSKQRSVKPTTTLRDKLGNWSRNICGSLRTLDITEADSIWLVMLGNVKSLNDIHPSFLLFSYDLKTQDPILGKILFINLEFNHVGLMRQLHTMLRSKKILISTSQNTWVNLLTKQAGTISPAAVEVLSFEITGKGTLAIGVILQGLVTISWEGTRQDTNITEDTLIMWL